MISEDDWGPARAVAERFFQKIGKLGDVGDEPLWNGEVVNASTPANLLHEVAHFQVAPEWRRFKPGYGLGIEPEGFVHWQLVPDVRTAVEESLASALGILWQAHLGYEDWSATAQSHGWGDDYRVRCDNVPDFLRMVGDKARLLLRLGLIAPDGTPQPVLATRWRAKVSDDG